tara:strand:+ start:229 stop:864 length:636 start_codon:yes stop_codon:yes gene_type:complete
MNNYRLGFELGFIKRAGYFGDLWKGVKSIADPSAWSMLGTKAEDLPKDEKANFRPWTKPSRGAKELTVGQGPGDLGNSFGKLNITFAGGNRGINPKDFTKYLPALKKRIMEGKMSPTESMPAEETKERIDQVLPRTNELLKDDYNRGQHGVQQGTIPEYSWWQDPSVLGNSREARKFIKSLPNKMTGGKGAPIQLKKLEPRLTNRLGQEYK